MCKCVYFLLQYNTNWPHCDYLFQRCFIVLQDNDTTPITNVIMYVIFLSIIIIIVNHENSISVKGHTKHK